MAAGAALVATMALQGAAVSAQTKSQQGRDKGQYIPTIWVDPDGCEHWVMDDGVEGYMTPHTNRQGIRVCRRGNVCGVMKSDQFFTTNSARISKHGQARLHQFFRSTKATSYIITGHTDSRASDAYNMKLSLNHANAVAKVAKSSGALSDNFSRPKGYHTCPHLTRSRPRQAHRVLCLSSPTTAF